MGVFKVGARERYYLFPPATLDGIFGMEGKGIRMMFILEVDNEVKLAMTWGRFIRAFGEGLRMTGKDGKRVGLFLNPSP